MHKTTVIILASGSGERFKSDLPKQFCKLGEKSILEHTLERFSESLLVSGIVLVTDLEYSACINPKAYKIQHLIQGGKTRQESSFLGVSNCSPDTEYVLIHDGARPLTSVQLIDRTINALTYHEAVACVISSSDTVYQTDKNNNLQAIPDRKCLKQVQTPQAFRYDLIKQAHQLAIKDKRQDFSDDAGMVFHYNLAQVFLLQGEETNIKITYPHDIDVAKQIIGKNK